MYWLKSFWWGKLVVVCYLGLTGGSLALAQAISGDENHNKWKSAKNYSEIVEIESQLFHSTQRIKELIASSDKDLATRAFWSQTVVDINAVKSGTRFDKFEYGVAWGKFYGFMAGSTGLDAPDEWRHCFEFGKSPKTPQLGNDVAGSDGPHLLLLGNEKYRIFVEESHGKNGSIARLSDSGGEIWKSVILSIFDSRGTDNGIGGLDGGSWQTCWCALLPGRNESEVVFWGFSNYGVCYYLVFDKVRGDIVSRAYFPIVEPVFLRKSKK